MKHLNSLPSFRSLIPLPFFIAMMAALLFSAFAQAAPLTSDQIQSFIDSMSDTEKLGNEYPALERARTEKPHDMSRPMSSSLKELEGHPEVREKLEDIVHDHGFDSVPEWADVGDRIFTALMAINFQNMPDEQRAMMESMTAQEDTTNMNDAKTLQMKQMADYMRGAMTAADTATSEDIEAVRPFLDELQAMSEK